MAKHTAEDFRSGKAAVVGLAVHNAKKAVNKARQMKDDESATATSFYIVRMELQAYTLWSVGEACDIVPVAFAPTNADFSPFVTAANLRALADKYKGTIGFVSKRETGRTVKWDTLPVPANKRSAKKTA